MIFTCDLDVNTRQIKAVPVYKLQLPLRALKRAYFDIALLAASSHVSPALNGTIFQMLRIKQKFGRTNTTTPT